MGMHIWKGFCKFQDGTEKGADEQKGEGQSGVDHLWWLKVMTLV